MLKSRKVRSICAILPVIMLVIMLAGCRGETVSNNNAKDPVKLVWYYPAEMTDDAGPIYEAANKIIREKINTEIKFEPYTRGEYGQKLPLAMSAGEQIDICFTSSWLFLYRDVVSKGGIIELDELINKYAPETKDMIPEKIWNAARINGKLYGIPNYQMSFVQPALVFQKELVEKYNLQDKINSITKLADLTPIFEVIKNNESNIIPISFSPTQSMYSYGSKDDYYDVVDGVIGVNNSLKAYNLLDGEPAKMLMDTYALAREWNQKGFFHKDVGIPRDFTAELNAGMYFLFYDTYKPGIEAEEELIHGYPVFVKTLGDPILSQASVTGTLSAIGRTSKNPEKAMEFLELVNTDKELYNILIFGLEGRNYKEIGEDQIEVLPESRYNTYAWAMGCNFNAYRLPGQDADVWEKTKELNEAAYESPLLNYFIDSEKTKSEISNISNYLKEYQLALDFGLLENYEEVAKELWAKVHDDAEKVRAEVQRQIDESRQ